MNGNEKELIGGLQRFSTEDGPGIRTTLFFNGCPLRCKWCHNPELIDFEPTLVYTKNKCIYCGRCTTVCPEDAIAMTPDGLRIDRDACGKCGKCAKNCCTEALRISGEKWDDENLLEELKKDKGFYGETGGGVTFSGGEVTSQFNYAYRLLKKLRSDGIDVAIDTCGYCEEKKLMQLCEGATTILFDIKSMNDEKHKCLTGMSNRLILNNLEILSKSPVTHDKIMIRLPLVHQVNDTQEDMKAVCNMMNRLGLKKVEGLPYHSLGVAKARNSGKTATEFETPPDDHIDKIADWFREEGLIIKIMGRDD